MQNRAQQETIPMKPSQVKKEEAKLQGNCVKHIQTVCSKSQLKRNKEEVEK